MWRGQGRRHLHGRRSLRLHTLIFNPLTSLEAQGHPGAGRALFRPDSVNRTRFPGVRKKNTKESSCARCAGSAVCAHPEPWFLPWNSGAKTATTLNWSLPYCACFTLSIRGIRAPGNISFRNVFIQNINFTNDKARVRLDTGTLYPRDASNVNTQQATSRGREGVRLTHTRYTMPNGISGTVAALPCWPTWTAKKATGWCKPPWSRWHD